MALGRPLVATAVGGMLELIDRDRSGVLVPAGNSESLAEAIVQLAGDPARRSALGAEGRRRYVENYTATLMAERYAHLLSELLPRP